MDRKHLLAKRLTDLREHKDWSKTKVAEKLHIARTTYTCYERNIYEPDILRLMDIADLYNTSIDFLVGYRKINHNYTLPKDITSLKEAYAFLDNIDVLIKDYSEEQVIRFAKAILYLSK